MLDALPDLPNVTDPFAVLSVVLVAGLGLGWGVTNTDPSKRCSSPSFLPLFEGGRGRTVGVVSFDSGIEC